VDWKVGLGMTFWEEEWCGEITLKHRFPRLYIYIISNNKIIIIIKELGRWNVSRWE